MGVAARKIAHAHVAAPARPVLRLVRGGHPRGVARSAAAASNIFRVATFCLVVLAFAGAMRVTFAARAAEASIDAWELKAEVKAEKLILRTLEADRSALAAPSRIEAVACQTLNMGRPTQVAYLQLPSDGTVPGDGSPAPTPTASRGVAERDDGPGVLATLMDLAAGEAQVMLVGDVGLGSLR